MPKKTDEINSLIEELGKINERMAPALARISVDKDRAKILEEKLAELAELNPDEPDVVHAAQYGCKIGMCRNKTEIEDMAKAMAAVKKTGIPISAAFTISLEKLKLLVGEDKYEALVVTERSGPRPIDTFRLVEKAA